MSLPLAASVASALSKTASLIIEIISFFLATTKLLCIIGLLLSGPAIYLHHRKIVKARESRIEGIILRLIKKQEIRDRVAGLEDSAKVKRRAQGQEIEGWM